jgi:putative transposase
MLFRDLLSQISKMFRVEIHGFCLMNNHYRLLIHIPAGNLKRAMRHLNGVSTQRYNRLKNTDGALFRGRYKTILIEPDAYLLNVSRYIYFKPAAAGKWPACHKASLPNSLVSVTMAAYRV